jgi:hypothetical protein
VSEFIFRISDLTPDPEVDIVDAGLETFNKQAASLHTIELLVCFAKSLTGEVVGGAMGVVYRWQLAEIGTNPRKTGTFRPRLRATVPGVSKILAGCS